MKYLKNPLLAASLFCSLAQADEAAPNEPVANIFATLSDRGISASLRGKDLTSAWRILRVTAAPEQTDLLRAMSGMGRGGDLEDDEMFYTRGDVIAVAGQTYLVAYRELAPSDPLELRRQQQFRDAWKKENDDGDATTMSIELPPLDENATLALSLISIGKGANLNDIRPFDPAKNLMTAKGNASRKVQIERSLSQSNLKQVALALKQYIQDWDEVYPPMRAARSAKEITANMDSESPTAPVQAALMPYAKSTEVFLHPGTGRPYLPNYKISRKNEFEIKNSAGTIMFFEDAPDAEGKRNVAFVDGHVEAFAEADFQKMRKAQGISESGLPPAAKPKAKPPVKPKAKTPAPRPRGRGVGSGRSGTY